MTRTRYLFLSCCAAALLAAPVADALAAKRSISTFDEYKKIGVGLLLSEEKRLEYKEVEEVPRKLPEDIKFVAASNQQESRQDRALSHAVPLEDVIASYQAEDYDAALKGLLPWARSGEVLAQELLGLMYREGHGINQNSEQAAYWLKKAAENGSSVSQHHLGTMYFIGDGVEQNHIKALMWLYNAEATYEQDAPGKQRVTEDIKNLSLRLTKRDQERSRNLSQDWLTAMRAKMENKNEDEVKIPDADTTSSDDILDDDLKSLLNKRAEPKYSSGDEEGERFE